MTQKGRFVKKIEQIGYEPPGKPETLEKESAYNIRDCRSFGSEEKEQGKNR